MSLLRQFWSQLSQLIAIPYLTDICELVVHRYNKNCQRIFYSETIERQKERTAILLVFFCSLTLHYLSDQMCLSLLLDLGTCFYHSCRFFFVPGMSFRMETAQFFRLEYLALFGLGIGTVCLLCDDNLAPILLLLMGIHIPWHLAPIVFSLFVVSGNWGPLPLLYFFWLGSAIWSLCAVLWSHTPLSLDLPN